MFCTTSKVEIEKGFCMDWNKSHATFIIPDEQYKKEMGP